MEFDECEDELEVCEEIRDECILNCPPDDLSNYQWEWLDPAEYAYLK